MEANVPAPDAPAGLQALQQLGIPLDDVNEPDLVMFSLPKLIRPKPARTTIDVTTGVPDQGCPEIRVRVLWCEEAHAELAHMCRTVMERLDDDRRSARLTWSSPEEHRRPAQLPARTRITVEVKHMIQHPSSQYQYEFDDPDSAFFKECDREPAAVPVFRQNIVTLMSKLVELAEPNA